MAKKTNSERCREYRLRKKAERAAAAKAAAPRRPRAQKEGVQADVEARREALRAKYAQLREAGGKEYEKMLVAARERAARYHARVRAAKKAEARAAKKGAR